MALTEAQRKKKEIMIPIKLIAIMFFITLFLCLTIETQAERFPLRHTFYIIVTAWQLIFGTIALTNIKRTALFYLFFILFLLPLIATCIVLSYLVLLPLIATHQVYAISIMLIGSILNFYISFLGFGTVFKETLEDNIASGRIDLGKGNFSFSIPPKMLDYKNPKMRKISNFLMINLGTIAFIGPVLSFYVSRSSDINFKNVYGGILCYLMSLVIGWALSGSFYNYRWIRAWEKGSGRLMVTRYV